MKHFLAVNTFQWPVTCTQEQTWQRKAGTPSTTSVLAVWCFGLSGASLTQEGEATCLHSPQPRVFILHSHMSSFSTATCLHSPLHYWPAEHGSWLWFCSKGYIGSSSLNISSLWERSTKNLRLIEWCVGRSICRKFACGEVGTRRGNILGLDSSSSLSFHLP